MFNEHILRHESLPRDQILYLPNDHSPAKDHLFDLTDQFPSLFEQ
jgi:hypothetical protein